MLHNPFPLHLVTSCSCLANQWVDLVQFSRKEEEVGLQGHSAPDKPQLQTGNAGKIWHLGNTTPKLLATTLPSKQLQTQSMFHVEKQKRKDIFKKEWKMNEEKSLSYS